MKPIYRRMIFVAIGCGVALLAIVAVVVTILTARDNRVPDPNGYTDLLKAAGLVNANLESLSGLNHDQLRDVISSNSAPLRMAGVALSNHCAASTQELITNFSTIMTDMMALKGLARLLAAEGRLAEMENRPADAAKSYITSMRLGVEMSNGGLLINRAVGIACEGVGAIPLAKVLPKLTCAEMKGLIEELEEIDEATPTWSSISHNENRFVWANVGHLNVFSFVSELWQARKTRINAKQRHDVAAAFVRLLTAELALRVYQCEKQKVPASLEDLVPNYLTRVPSDPFKRGVLAYRPTPASWVVYSVGPDCVDNGGISAEEVSGASNPLLGTSENINSGDILYNSRW
jgi:hypothetical protein